MQNVWKSLEGKGYTIVDLGRPAIFLIPSKKLEWNMGEITVEEDLHRFLVKHFAAYTSALIPSFGIWKNSDEVTIRDECRQYEVSFVGKERIPILLEKIAAVTRFIQEDCIYVKAGQYSCLVYPN